MYVAIFTFKSAPKPWEYLYHSPLSLCKSSGKASSATSMGPKCTKTVCGQENLWEKNIEKISISKLSECWWTARSTWYASIAFRNIKAWHKDVLLNFWVWVHLRWFIIPHWHLFNMFTKTESKNSSSLKRIPSLSAVPWFLMPNLLQRTWCLSTENL